MGRHHAWLSLCLFATPFVTRAGADIGIYSDGRRATIEDPRKDSKGEWTGTLDGRRQALRAGELVALVDAEGRETSLVPELLDGPLSATHEAALASLGDPKSEDWFLAAETLSTPPTRAVFDALLELSKGSKKDLRARSILALTRLRTKESSLAAARAVLAEKDLKVRRDAASGLFGVREILRRSEAAELTRAGLADDDPLVRVEFALIAPLDLERAGEVLRKDGLKNSDHHVRESAAVELGRRGDAAGESVLLAMLPRQALPGMEEEPELGTRFLIREQVEICELLGQLGGKAAKAGLVKAKSSPHEDVRNAANAALTALEAR